MGTIESLLNKPLHEMTNEELAEFTRMRRRDMTAIIEEDLSSGTTRTSVGRRATKALSAEAKAEMEDNL